MRFTALGFAFLLFASCNHSNPVRKAIYFPDAAVIKNKKTDFEENGLMGWHFKDILKDTVPGISLDRAYDEILKDKKGDTVVIAVIDMSVDIFHEDLKTQIWQNSLEIPGNRIDDDKNGYVDDIHGWNFLGHQNGGASEFVNFEYTRIRKKYDSIFFGRDLENIKIENQSEFKLYQSASKKYAESMVEALSDFENAQGVVEYDVLVKDALKKYFPKGIYSVPKLDSLAGIFKEDDEMTMYIDDMKIFVEYDITTSSLLEEEYRAAEKINKLLNLEYDDRELIGDDENDISDTEYGNNILNHNVVRMNHGTTVSGAIAASRANNIGSQGISDYVKIMPLCVSGYGNEHDKDMALAIRYAVDNGAKVINISSIKYFSLYETWVHNAIKYASDKDVLIVHSSGNESVNLDNKETYTYPNDRLLEGTEIANNFINVGASTYNINSDLIAKFSNYGIRDVDIFAPGENIYTTNAENGKYKYSAGTSLSAAIVSGVAGLLRSYYPELKAGEIKQIIIDSGVEYKILVKAPAVGTDKNHQLPFNELSKSGRIVNAYNALLLANELSISK